MRAETGMGSSKWEFVNCTQEEAKKITSQLPKKWYHKISNAKFIPQPETPYRLVEQTFPNDTEKYHQAISKPHHQYKLKRNNSVPSLRDSLSPKGTINKRGSTNSPCDYQSIFAPLTVPQQYSDGHFLGEGAQFDKHIFELLTSTMGPITSYDT